MSTHDAPVVRRIKIPQNTNRSGHPWPVAAKRVDCRNSGVAAQRPMLTWPMGLRSEATHGRDLISRRVTG
jgi:hypothetical protein